MCSRQRGSKSFASCSNGRFVSRELALSILNETFALDHTFARPPLASKGVRVATDGDRERPIGWLLAELGAPLRSCFAWTSCARLWLSNCRTDGEVGRFGRRWAYLRCNLALGQAQAPKAMRSGIQHQPRRETAGAAHHNRSVARLLLVREVVVAMVWRAF